MRVHKIATPPTTNIRIYLYQSRVVLIHMRYQLALHDREDLLHLESYVHARECKLMKVKHFLHCISASTKIQP